MFFFQTNFTYNSRDPHSSSLPQWAMCYDYYLSIYYVYLRHVDVFSFALPSKRHSSTNLSLVGKRIVALRWER